MISPHSSKSERPCFMKTTILFFMLMLSVTFSDAYSEHCQTSKEGFAKITNDKNTLTIFTKRSILDAWQGS